MQLSMQILEINTNGKLFICKKCTQINLDLDTEQASVSFFIDIITMKNVSHGLERQATDGDLVQQPYLTACHASSSGLHLVKAWPSLAHRRPLRQLRANGSTRKMVRYALPFNATVGPKINKFWVGPIFPNESKMNHFFFPKSNSSD